MEWIENEETSFVNENVHAQNDIVFIQYCQIDS